MPDSDLQTWWPDLWSIITELRRTKHVAVADLLIDAVRAGATSGEILGAVGVVLREHQGCRSQLGEVGIVAWNAVMADVRHAYPGAGFQYWLARLTGRLGWIAGRSKRNDTS